MNDSVFVGSISSDFFTRDVGLVPEGHQGCHLRLRLGGGVKGSKFRRLILPFQQFIIVD